MARDDRFPDEKGMDRRTFIKAGVGAGAVALAGTLVASGKSIIPPVPSLEGEVNEGFIFAKGDTPNPFGFDAFAGQEAKAEHFTEPWMGAAALWRALFDPDGNQLPGTGFPVLLIRTDPELFRRPAEWTTDDYVPDLALVAIWDRCVHLCCFPQWHLESIPPAYQDYEASRVPRTFLAGQDPIWCRCHNSQYDPVTFVWDIHPNGTLYIGANFSHGPATRGLPAISMTESGGRLVGAKFLDDAPKPPQDVVAHFKGKAAKIYRDWYFAYCR
jgi:Rieske Fe-S protein